MKFLKVLLLTFILLFTFSCTKTDENVTTFASDLYKNKVNYIGDNSLVGKLLNVLSMTRLGNYSIALQTKNPPYGLEIIFENDDVLNPDLLDTDELHPELKENSILILALIYNLSYIDWKLPNANFTVELAEIEEELGIENIENDNKNLSNLKTFASNSSKVQELLDLMYEKGYTIQIDKNKINIDY